MLLADRIVAAGVVLRLPLKGELFVRFHWRFAALVKFMPDHGLSRKETTNDDLRIQTRNRELELITYIISRRDRADA